MNNVVLLNTMCTYQGHASSLSMIVPIKMSFYICIIIADLIQLGKYPDRMELIFSLEGNELILQQKDLKYFVLLMSTLF
jgi:hypothetical protein